MLSRTGRRRMARMITITAMATGAPTFVPCDAVAQVRGALNGIVHVAAGDSSNVAGGALVNRAADRLTDASATFRDMLAVVQRAEHLKVQLHPVTMARAAMGVSDYSVSAGWTIGVVRVNVFRTDPRLQARAVAHELAHATEIACLPPQADAAGLRAIIRARGRRTSRNVAETYETPFAIALERTVMREFVDDNRAPSRLLALAQQYGLTLCAGRGEVLAQR